MKEICLFLMIALIILLTSCSYKDDAQVADETFEQVFNAIQNHDETALKNLFSNSVRNEVSDFDESIVDFLDFIQGEVLSYEDLNGDGVHLSVEDGQKRKEIRAIYDIKTSQKTYHIAIKECAVDTFDPENEGIFSIYIISAEDWKETYAYRGGGKSTPGIVID